MHLNMEKNCYSAFLPKKSLLCAVNLKFN